MDHHRISSSPVPLGVQLSTIVVSPGQTCGADPLTSPKSGEGTDTSPTGTALAPPRTSPQAPSSHGNNFSLASNMLCGQNATSNSWDAAGDGSNLTFSQVAPTTGRSYFLTEPERVFTVRESCAGLPKDDWPPVMAKLSPRRRSEAAVKFAAFDGGEIGSLYDARTNAGNDRRSFSWHPHGLFGTTLERFQSREAASHFNLTAGSLAGTVLTTDVPVDLPPEPSICVPRRLSGLSVHAIQFNPDYGGSASPFMSVSSPALSRRSISSPALSRHSISFQRLSVPQLSAESMQMSVNSLEHDPFPVTATGAVGAGDETQMSLPRSSIASPAFNNETVAAEHVEPPRSTRARRPLSPSTDSDALQALSSHLSPHRVTERFRAKVSFRVRLHSKVSVHTASGSTAAMDQETEAALDEADFLMAAEATTLPTSPLTNVMLSVPAMSTTGMYVTQSLLSAPSLEEQLARAKIVHAEGVAFEKLRGLEVSEALVQRCRSRALERRSSKYAGDALLRQLEKEEKEQFHSEMRARMRAAEDEHRESMRALRGQEQCLPRLPMGSRVGSSKRKVLDASPATSNRPRASTSSQPGLVNAASFPLPRLAPRQLSLELRNAPPNASENTNGDAELLSEICRQREMKRRTSLNRSLLK